MINLSREELARIQSAIDAAQYTVASYKRADRSQAEGFGGGHYDSDPRFTGIESILDNARAILLKHGAPTQGEIEINPKIPGSLAVCLVLVAEIEIDPTGIDCPDGECSADMLKETARQRLDGFREAVQPSAEYGITLYEANFSRREVATNAN
jgi:hypothetical protein